MKIRICMACGVLFSPDYAEGRPETRPPYTENKCPVCHNWGVSVEVDKDDLPEADHD